MPFNAIEFALEDIDIQRVRQLSLLNYVTQYLARSNCTRLKL